MITNNQISEITLIIAVFLFPILKIIFGILLYKKTPDINYLYGYRTKRSMGSDEAWDYANKITGKIWLILGILETIVFLPLVLIFKSETMYLILVFIPLVFVVIFLIIVERQLKNKFSND